MAVKARDQVTVAVSVDVASVDNYYKLQASTATPPARPTTASPSGWTTTEPTYDGTSTNTLYICQKTTLTDGTFYWSLVSKSTSYEAAKTAYNLANSANNTANTTQQNLDNLQIGGRNLLVGTDATTEITRTRLSTTTSGYIEGIVFRVPRVEGCSQYVVSFEAKSTIEVNVYCYWYSPNTTISCESSTGHMGTSSDGYCSVTVATSWQRYWVKWTQSDTEGTDKSLIIGRLSIAKDSDYTVSFRAIKLETGNRATDWTPAPEDVDAAVSESGMEYIVGTQTAQTGSWTGVTKDSSLYVGKKIAYKLPYAGSGNASLQLKDSSGNNVGGNIAVYLGTTRMTTHFGAGAVIQMVYDGTYWRATSIPNSNNYDRRLHNNYVKAAANLERYSLCAGTSAGYRTIAAGLQFDLAYPILYLNANYVTGQTYAVASGGQTAAMYEAIPGVTVTYTGTPQSPAANALLYLKGTIDGGLFEVASSNFLTTVVPTAATTPTEFYIPLGVFANGSTTAIYFSSSKDIYAFIDGKFRQVTPTEIISTHRIYYRSASSTEPPSAPTTWVSEATGNVYNAWTTKVPPMAASTAAGQTKYLYLYTCEQRQRLDGTLTCTTVQLDENTTVIDGGQIITNSITANQIAANSITANEIDATNLHVNSANIDGTLTIGKVDGLQTQLNAKATPSDITTAIDAIEVGGKNLLAFSDRKGATATTVTGLTMTFEDNGWIALSGTLTNTTAGVFCIWGTTNALQAIYDGAEYYTMTIEDEGVLVPSKVGVQTYGQQNSVNKYHIEYAPGSYTYTDLTDFISRVNLYFMASAKDTVINGRIRLKLEKGNKATDWTPAPEDTDAAIATKLDSSVNRIWYAECSTAAGTVAKTATITPATTAFTLTPGQTVNVLFKATNTGAAANLTLSVNGTVAKGIRYLANGGPGYLPAANYLRINQIVPFTYDGTYWMADFSYNSDTYNRTRWQNVVRAIATANSVTSAHIICGTSAGYRDIAASVSFDLSYPLLYTGTTIAAASGTTDNTYLSINSINLTNNGTVQGAAQYTLVYLKGTLSGNSFTIADSNYLTCTVPTSEDGFVYIPLGMFYNSTTNIYFSSSKELWAYVDGAFGPVSIREASAAAKTATTYITHVDDNGITIHPKSTTSNRAAINANGMEIFKGDVSVASYGDSARIGKANGDRVVVDSTNGITIYKANSKRLQTTANGVDVYGSDSSTSIASFGSTTRIGLLNGWKTTIEPDGIRLYSGNYNNGNSPTICIESDYHTDTTVGGAIRFDPEVTGVQTEIAGTSETNSAWLSMQAYRDLSPTKNTGAALVLQTDPDFSTRAVLFATDGDNDSEITVTGDGIDMSNDLVVTGTVNGDALESNGAIYADTTVYAGYASTTGEAIYTGGSDYARFGYRSGGTYNYLTMGIDSNDDRYITLSSRIPWLSALDLSDAVKPYRSGETISGATRVVGYVTASTKELRFTIPLCKPVANGLTFNSMSIIPRGETGTLSTITPTSSTVTLARDPSGINVIYTASAAISGMTNNHAYALQVSYSFVVQS